MGVLPGSGGSGRCGGTPTAVYCTTGYHCTTHCREKRWEEESVWRIDTIELSIPIGQRRKYEIPTSEQTNSNLQYGKGRFFVLNTDIEWMVVSDR